MPNPSRPSFVGPIRWLLGLVLVGLVVLPHGAAGPAPRLESVEPFALPGPPEPVNSIAVGSEGRLFVLDRVNGAVLAYDAKGRPAGTFGKGTLASPTHLLSVGDTVGVLEGRGTIFFYDGRTLLPKKTTTHLARYNPGLGAALTEKRIVYGGMGYEGEHPKDGEPFHALVLFSTDWDGKDLRVVERRYVPWEVNRSFQVMARSYFCPWGGGGLAVSSFFPGRLWLLDAEGRVVRATEAPQAPLPQPPPEGRYPPDEEWLVLFHGVPHVEALFAVDNHLAAVVRERTASGHRLHLWWYDGQLRLLKKEPLVLPVALRDADFLLGTTPWGKKEILLLLVRRDVKPWGLGTSLLFKLRFR